MVIFFIWRHHKKLIRERFVLLATLQNTFYVSLYSPPAYKHFVKSGHLSWQPKRSHNEYLDTKNKVDVFLLFASSLRLLGAFFWQWKGWLSLLKKYFIVKVSLKKKQKTHKMMSCKNYSRKIPALHLHFWHGHKGFWVLQWKKRCNPMLSTWNPSRQGEWIGSSLKCQTLWSRHTWQSNPPLISADQQCYQLPALILWLICAMRR